MYDKSISDPDPSSIKSVVNQSLSHPSAVNVHKEASLFTMIAKLLWKYVGYQSGRWLHLIKGGRFHRGVLVSCSAITQTSLTSWEKS